MQEKNRRKRTRDQQAQMRNEVWGKPTTYNPGELKLSEKPWAWGRVCDRTW